MININPKYSVHVATIYPSDKEIYHSTLSEIIKIENTSISHAGGSKKSRAPSFFRRFINKITNSDTISRSESSELVGMSINPKIAVKFGSKIEFNSAGEIIKLKKNSIKKKDYAILVENRIKPLNETPEISKERIRTPGEAMIDISGVIKTTGDMLKNKAELETLIENTWMDGALSQQSLYNLVELIKIKISYNPVISKEIDNIMQTLEKEFFVTKKNDNYYGRLFETECAKYIIENPNVDMINVRDTVSSFILDDFSTMPHKEQLSLCNSIASAMASDPPSWRYNLSHANIFIEDEKPASFISMMKFSGEYSVPLVLSTAIKYIIFSQGTRELKNKATEYYVSRILPQRQLIDSPSAAYNKMSNAYGLFLSYQKNHLSQDEKEPGYGIRPMDRYVRPTVGVDLTEHDMVALSNERAIGIGISGSANILNFLFRRLQLKDEDFPMDEAKLATAAWLSYSGGHSFNEAYSVFGFMNQGNFKPLSFNKLKIASELSAKAIAHAYGKVIDASVALSGCSDE